MLFLLLSTKDSPIYLQAGVVPAYQGPLIPGKHWSSRTDAGLIVLQEKEVRGSKLRFHFFNLLKKLFISHQFPDKFLQTFVVLGEDINYYIEGHGQVHLRKGDYIMVPSPGKNIKAELKEGRVYEIFEAVYSKESITAMNSLFPELKLLLYDEQGKWIPAAREAGTRALETIREMQEYPFNNTAFETQYYDDHLKRLFYLLIAQANANTGTLMSDVEAAFRTKEEILKDISTIPVIPELAKRFLLPIHRLKSAFRRTFGMNPVPFIHKTRMEIAYTEVTQTNKSIKVIAMELGFKKPQSFATKFKRKYGKSPMDARNEVRNG